MSESKGRPFNEDALIAQIGQMNILAISGGRVYVSKHNNETVGSLIFHAVLVIAFQSN
jgi:hypothetical protein